MRTIKVPIEVSGRHVHLSDADVQTLFGAPLAVGRMISQPKQFVAKETVVLETSAAAFTRVAIVGPTRSATQVELSATDARTLKIEAPLALSGESTELKEPITLAGPAGRIEIKKNVIIAKRHLHISPEEAASLGLQHHQVVAVRTTGPRAVSFEQVIVVSRPGVDEMSFMLDTDEANAAGVRTGDHAELLLP